jgi:ribosome-associated heat shock protein Hsp15
MKFIPTPNQGSMQSDRPAPAEVRLDVWLDVSCLFKTRSEAQRACKSGKVEVDGVSGKPHRVVRVGDEIRITRQSGLPQIVVVQALAERSLPKAEARTLYEDRTPARPPEEIALRRAERVFRAAQRAAGPPGKRQRRALKKVRGY